MKRWLRAIGVYRGFLLTSFMPTALGVTLAWRAGFGPDWPLFGLTMLAVWLFHAGTNLTNDYYDHVSGADDINEIRTPFSGGTRVIQEGLLTPRRIRNAGYMCFALGWVLFFILAARTTGWVLLPALFGFLSGWLYTARPVWLAYRGLGELMIGLNFGPAVVLTAYLIQTGTVALPPLWAGMVMGCWTAAIITINQLPDFEADRQAGKRNLVARFGKLFGLRLWASLLYLSLSFLIAGVFVRALPPDMILGVLTLPLVIRLIDRSPAALDDLPATIAACGNTIKYEVLTWALMLAGLLAAGLTGIGA